MQAVTTEPGLTLERVQALVWPYAEPVRLLARNDVPMAELSAAAARGLGIIQSVYESG